MRSWPILWCSLWLWAGPAAADWLTYPYDHEVPRSRSYSGGHQAIDFASPCGVDLYAAAEGEVIQVVQGNGCRRCYDCYQGCGNAYVDGPCANNQIYIRHPNGWQTRYLHIEQGSSAVQVGQVVHAGQRIGRAGNVGWTCGVTGCHLHFALVDPNGAAVDPDAGHWTNPLRYGGGPPPAPPRDEQAPVCQYFEGPPTEQILTDGGLRVRWRVQDGQSGVTGAAQAWDAPLDGLGEPQFRFDAGERHEGYVELGWAGVGRHQAYVKGWDAAGNTCVAEAGPYWFFPTPFLQAWLVAGPLLADGAPAERLDARPLGDPAALLPLPGVGAFSPVNAATPHVDLDALVGGDHALAYAATWCHNPGPAQPIEVRVGSDDGFELWLNGVSLARDATPRGAAPDQDVVPAELAPGWNLLLLAIEEKTGGWGFYARLTAPGRAEAPPEGVTCGLDFRSGPCEVGDCPAGYRCVAGACAAAPEPADAGGGPVAPLDAGVAGDAGGSPRDDGGLRPDGRPPGAPGGGPGRDGGSPAGDGGAPVDGGETAKARALTGGCQSGGGPGAPWLGALGLLLWGLRRRRRG